VPAGLRQRRGSSKNWRSKRASAASSTVAPSPGRRLPARDTPAAARTAAPGACGAEGQAKRCCWSSCCTRRSSRRAWRRPSSLAGSPRLSRCTRKGPLPRRQGSGPRRPRRRPRRSRRRATPASASWALPRWSSASRPARPVAPAAGAITACSLTPLAVPEAGADGIGAADATPAGGEQQRRGSVTLC
jgi:hypothetical protein